MLFGGSRGFFGSTPLFLCSCFLFMFACLWDMRVIIWYIAPLSISIRKWKKASSWVRLCLKPRPMLGFQILPIAVKWSFFWTLSSDFTIENGLWLPNMRTYSSSACKQRKRPCGSGNSSTFAFFLNWPGIAGGWEVHWKLGCCCFNYQFEMSYVANLFKVTNVRYSYICR